VAKSLDNREFLSWLLDRLDPEDMTIQVGAKQIWVSEYNVKVVFGLPCKGGYPPMITDDTGKKILRDVAERLFPDQPSPKGTKINPNRAAEMIDIFNNTGWPNLDEDLCIRIFFMVLNSNFLTPNTYCYIRPIDALWCCNTRAIAGYNWCKIVYDNTREAGRKWKVARCRRMDMPTILGCSLFLMVRTRYKCNSFSYTFLQLTTHLISVYQMKDFVPQPPHAPRGA
jgi:hypothetical protein